MLCIILLCINIIKSEIASVSLDNFGNAILHNYIFDKRVTSAIYQNKMNTTGL